MCSRYISRINSQIWNGRLKVYALVILIHSVELLTAEIVIIKLPSAKDECDYFPIAWPTKYAIILFIYFYF